MAKFLAKAHLLKSFDNVHCSYIILDLQGVRILLTLILQTSWYQFLQLNHKPNYFSLSSDGLNSLAVVFKKVS